MSDEKFFNKKDDKSENLISTDDKNNTLTNIDDDEIDKIIGGVCVKRGKYNVCKIGQELDDGPVEVKIKI